MGKAKTSTRNSLTSKSYSGEVPPLSSLQESNTPSTPTATTMTSTLSSSGSPSTSPAGTSYEKLISSLLNAKEGVIEGAAFINLLHTIPGSTTQHIRISDEN
jgi:hypothetical protein